MGFKIKVRSKHESHEALRDQMPSLPFKGVIRLGSTTSTSVVGEGFVECNTVEAIKNSACKRRMKTCFEDMGVITADWHNEVGVFGPEDYPIVAKHRLGSRGTGNYLLKTPERAKEWAKEKTNIDDFIFEKYHNFSREYRLYVTQHECYFAIRKLRKGGTEDKYRWRFRNDDTHWVAETNPLFEKPSCWSDIVSQSCLACKATGLDISAVDVKVQQEHGAGKKTRFIILETNSAFMLHNKDLAATLKIVPIILQRKYDAAH